MHNLFVLLAAKTNQDKFQEQLAEAQFMERMSYIVIGIGIAVLLLGIPLGIYFDRKKKARKQLEENPPAD